MASASVKTGSSPASVGDVPVALNQEPERIPGPSQWAHASEHATEMVTQHGFDASMIAGLKADALFARGDYIGSRDWVLIIRRIRQLLSGLSDMAN